VAAPGLEPLVAEELRGLGIANPAPEPGGVWFQGSPEDLARANLWLRTATRVLVRLGQFHARALGELERRARLLPWAGFLPSGAAPRLRVTSRKSRLYHQRAIAERIGRAIAEATGGTATEAFGEEPQNGEPRLLVVVRLLRDECLISLDSSGGLLHQRGYRLATAKAPLRETLAAAMLLAAGWNGSVHLLDPFCGAGTIAIEAALLARRIAPGLHRRFAFESWPGVAVEALERLRHEARQTTVTRATVSLVASDRDAGAIRAARENAERAGVAGDIDFRQRSLSDVVPPDGPGCLITNPPYGVRIGDRRRLRDLYARLGEVARHSLPGWAVVLLVPSSFPLERDTGLAFTQLLKTVNGGLPVRLIRATIPAAGTALR
jgi:putative N6-adenine-specific DNA methylase